MSYEANCPTCYYPHEFRTQREGDREVAKWNARLAAELRDILRAERRATVERIREQVNKYLVDGDRAVNLIDLDNILDEEAAR